MTREEIGLAALEAGFMVSTAHGQNPHQLMPVSDMSTLERFAELVAAAEREECAKVCFNHARELKESASEWANTSKEIPIYMEALGAKWCAEAIRARGNK